MENRKQHSEPLQSHHCSWAYITSLLLIYIAASFLWFVVTNFLIISLPFDHKSFFYLHLSVVVFYILFTSILAYIGLRYRWLPILNQNKALTDSCQSLTRVLNGSQLGYWDWYLVTNEVKRNSIWAEMLGYKLEDIAFTTQQWSDFVHPDDRAKAWASINAVLAGEANDHEMTYRMKTKSGQYKWVLDRARVVEWDNQGNPTRMTGTHTDVEQLKIASLALQASEKRFRSIFENAGVGIAEVASDGSFQLVNDRFCKITGYSRDELFTLKKNFQAITHPDDIERDLSFYQQLLAGTRPNYDLEKRYIRKDGSVAWVRLSVSAFLDESLQLTSISAVQDITDLKHLQTELEHQAHTDYLTGIANRRYFMELAERELARVQRYAQPLAMIMIDIDHFKRVNDQFGHKMGDKVLQHIAQILNVGLRDLDIIARIGGEEFAVLLPQTNASLAYEVAERLIALVRSNDLHTELGVILHVTVSMGIAVLTEASQDIEFLMHRADISLYQAKVNGRDCIEMLV